MGVAPIGAIKKVLERAGMSIDDVDIVELNEAFAAQVIPIMDECDIPLEKLNPHGGAIALGHPFGMTGARIMTTLLNGLETDDGTIGLETMCVAGGQGEAMVVERLNQGGGLHRLADERRDPLGQALRLVLGREGPGSSMNSRRACGRSAASRSASLFGEDLVVRRPGDQRRLVEASELVGSGVRLARVRGLEHLAHVGRADASRITGRR